MRNALLFRIAFACAFCVWGASRSLAHDTWVQTNTNFIRVGDAVHVDLMLGNHGNEHRDFKLASKVGLKGATLEIVAPGGRRYDVAPQLIDTGYTPSEGFWSAPFVGAEPGLYMVAHTLDGVYHNSRGVKSAKTFFAVSKSLDRPAFENTGFDRPLGHALELVPLESPVAPMGPGQPIRVRALYEGEPMGGVRVSFIPRGIELAPGLDETYERTTDVDGTAEFTPKQANYYLIVVHHTEPEQKGDGYNETKYSATLTVFVPQLCPCCE